MIHFRFAMSGFSRMFLLICLAWFSDTCQAEPVVMQLGPPEPVPVSLNTFNTNLLTGIAFQGLRYDGPQLSDATDTFAAQALPFSRRNNRQQLLVERRFVFASRE